MEMKQVMYELMTGERDAQQLDIARWFFLKGMLGDKAVRADHNQVIEDHMDRRMIWNSINGSTVYIQLGKPLPLPLTKIEQQVRIRLQSMFAEELQGESATASEVSSQDEDPESENQEMNAEDQNQPDAANQPR